MEGRSCPAAERGASCGCCPWPQDGTLELYKELGAGSIKVTFHPSPAAASGEAPREAGRGEESWRPPGRFLAPTAWGPAVPLGGQSSQRPSSSQTRELARVVLSEGPAGISGFVSRTGRKQQPAELALTHRTPSGWRPQTGSLLSSGHSLMGGPGFAHPLVQSCEGGLWVSGKPWVPAGGVTVRTPSTLEPFSPRP